MIPCSCSKEVCIKITYENIQNLYKFYKKLTVSLSDALIHQNIILDSSVVIAATFHTASLRLQKHDDLCKT